MGQGLAHTAPFCLRVKIIVHFSAEKGRWESTPLQSTASDKLTFELIFQNRLDRFHARQCARQRGAETKKARHQPKPHRRSNDIFSLFWALSTALTPGRHTVA